MMIQMKSMIMIGKFDIFLTKIVHLRVGYARRIVVIVYDFKYRVTIKSNKAMVKNVKNL